MSGIAPDVSTAIEMARHGESVMTKCPAHDDGTASLHVSRGTTQPVVLSCQAGCDTERVIEAAGIDWADISTPLDEQVSEGVWTPVGPASHVYSYTDEQGVELFQCLRIPTATGKTFRQRRPDPLAQHGWDWRLGDVRRVLYRLPATLRAAHDGQVIYVVEGEKDVERAVLDGLAATCSPMGAGKWRDEYAESLRGATVVVVQDADEPGRAHARQVADSLITAECRVTIVESMMPSCKDYSDHRSHGGSVETLTVVWESHPKPKDDSGFHIQALLTAEFAPTVEVIPHMLAEANVAILTGPEGHGKSTLLRQIAACSASGIHPFMLCPMEPRRVMVLDVENPPQETLLDWRWLNSMTVRTTGSAIPNENLLIYNEWESEIDLLNPVWQAWLWERVQAFQPHIMVMGPVQNLVGRDVKDDEQVRKFKHAVNVARHICRTAFIIEHHPPHRFAGERERPTRGYGSSLFQKWPDFGYGLQQDDGELYNLVANRLPRNRSRRWPERLRQCNERNNWPWTEAPPESSATVYRIN